LGAQPSGFKTRERVLKGQKGEVGEKYRWLLRPNPSKEERPLMKTKRVSQLLELKAMT